MSVFVYRVVVDGRVVQEGFQASEVPKVGEPFPLAEIGGRIRKVTELTGEHADFEIHVTPLDEDDY